MQQPWTNTVADTPFQNIQYFPYGDILLPKNQDDRMQLYDRYKSAKNWS